MKPQVPYRVLKQKRSYKERARVLSAVGKGFNFPRNRALSPQAKGWITRRWRESSGVFHAENRFKFVPATRAERRKLAKTLPKSQVTKTGVLVQTPPGARARITKAGRLVVSKGAIREETFSLNRVRLAADPRSEIERIYRLAKGKNKKVFITFKGYEGRAKYTPGAFLYYLENDLLPELAGREDAEISSHFGIKVVSVNPKKSSHETKVSPVSKGHRSHR
jgi:hypothetical protein